jgi:MarR family transcriptional regulator, organic hydroperoxide resistance regulator
MNKTEKIDEVLKLFQKFSQTMAHYAFEPWKNLDVPLAQLKSLFIISIRGSTNIHNLAVELGVTPGNVTGIVDRLVEQGLLSRTHDLEDRRIILLQLTDKGREIIANIQESGMCQMAGILAHVSSEGLNCLACGIEALLAAAEQHQKENTELDP